MLYATFGQRLFAIGVRFFRSRHGDHTARAMAADAAHESWLRILCNKDQWSRSRGSLGPWIIAIHYHCLLEMARGAPKGDGPTDSEGDAPAPDLERRLLARQALEHLSQSLSPDEKEVLMTYYLTGDRNLVAASLGISNVALRKRIERLKDSIKNDARFSELLGALGVDGQTPGRSEE